MTSSPKGHPGFVTGILNVFIKKVVYKYLNDRRCLQKKKKSQKIF